VIEGALDSLILSRLPRFRVMNEEERDSSGNVMCRERVWCGKRR
jgi:hypothetical protein